MDLGPDISNTVHREIWRFAGIAAACLVVALALHPFNEGILRELWAGMLAGACLMSWTAAGAGLWASVRIRKSRLAYATAASVAIALFSTAYGYHVTFPK